MWNIFMGVLASTKESLLALFAFNTLTIPPEITYSNSGNDTGRISLIDDGENTNILFPAGATSGTVHVPVYDYAKDYTGDFTTQFTVSTIGIDTTPSDISDGQVQISLYTLNAGGDSNGLGLNHHTIGNKHGFRTFGAALPETYHEVGLFNVTDEVWEISRIGSTVSLKRQGITLATYIDATTITNILVVGSNSAGSSRISPWNAQFKNWSWT